MLFPFVWASLFSLDFRINTEASALAVSALLTWPRLTSLTLFSHTHLTEPLMWLYSRIFMSHSWINISIPSYETKSLQMLPLLSQIAFLLSLLGNSQASGWSVTLYGNALLNPMGRQPLLPLSWGDNLMFLLQHVLPCISGYLFAYLTPLCTINSSGTRTKSLLIPQHLVWHLDQQIIDKCLPK